jgi:alpha-tubulin suppressor-like RCC1 family protein
MENADLRCWGLNGPDGILGLKSTEMNVGDDEVPNDVPPINISPDGAAVVHVATGYAHTCALFDNGKVVCFGQAVHGTELGYNMAQAQADIGDDEHPSEVGYVDISSEYKVVQLAASVMSTCALLENGRVLCFGVNDNGVLGLPNKARIIQDVPSANGFVEVTSDASLKVTQISANRLTVCALIENGKVVCWGSDYKGANGHTEDIGDDETPAEAGYVDVSDTLKAVQVSCGKTHTCALLENGRVKCWGDNW